MRHARSAIATAFLTLLAPPVEAQQESPSRSDWDATLGAIALIVPRYSGSDEYRVLPLPLTQVTFRNRVFIGPSTVGVGGAVGAYVVRTPRVGVAAELGFQDSRPASRASALAGIDDRDALATLGGSLTYRAGLLEALVGVTQGLNDGAGLVGTTRLSASRALGRLFVTLGAGAAFADAKHMRREFGLTEAEASRRQDLIAAGDDRLDPDDGRVYRPSGGLRHVGAALSLAYGLSQRWSLVGFGGVDRLSDKAAESPLVRRREQFSGGLGLGYRF